MIRWAFDTLDHHPELARGEAPPGLLGPQETQTLAKLKVQKRRRDWLMGRHTLKSLLAEHLRSQQGREIRLSDLEVIPASNGSPEVWTAGRRLDLPVSISHASGRAASAVSPRSSVAVGIDLETVAPRPELFVDDYFTNDEAAQVDKAPVEDRHRLITTIWSGKEAILKALRLGLTVNPKQVTCRPGPLRSSTEQGWEPMEVTASPRALSSAKATGKGLRGFWRPLGGQVLTLVTCACDSYVEDDFGRFDEGRCRCIVARSRRSFPERC